MFDCIALYLAMVPEPLDSKSAAYLKFQSTTESLKVLILRDLGSCVAISQRYRLSNLSTLTRLVVQCTSVPNAATIPGKPVQVE